MQKTIERIEYFSCGFCTNYSHKIFTNIKKEKLVFNAGVFLIKHRLKGYILYDTGYSPKLLGKKLKYRLYRLLNPVKISPNLTIDYQLKKKGIEISEIKYVILSHLHPDHIGGLEMFTSATIIMTNNCWKDYKQNSLKSLIFKEFIPQDIEERLIKINIFDKQEKFKYLDSFDLFSDGGILLTMMEGHSKGQCCAYFPENNIFLGSDSCWNIKFLKNINNMKFIPKFIQENITLYKENNNILKKLITDGVKVIFSHDAPKRIRRILNEKNI